MNKQIELLLKKQTLFILSIAILIIILSFSYLFILNQETTTKEITLTLTEVREGEEAWVPQTIFLKKGDDVKFTIVNGDDEFGHRFSIPDLAVLTDIIPPANKQIIINIKFEEVGEFSFNDPISNVGCTQAPPEEVSRRDLLLNLERQMENLKDAKNIDEVTHVVNQFSRLIIEYEEVAPSNIKEVIINLENASTMNSVSDLSNELEEALNVFEETLLPPCIDAGIIVVSE